MKLNINDLKTKTRRAKYYFSNDILTLSNIVMGSVIVVSIVWVWGSISAMEKNYAIQKKLELKQRQALIEEINYQTLQYEQKYLKSSEYQELAVREKLGLALPGEHVLVLPKYPEEKKKQQTETSKQSNFTQWMNFIFGGNAQKSSK
ncbi:MAG: hypothetical protein HXK93_01635 [Candidatus Nanogingivalaceae bacterium]|nr:hypothetical protein [Candidatus Nanogingivalaceae bacterium]